MNIKQPLVKRYFKNLLIALVLAFVNQSYADSTQYTYIVSNPRTEQTLFTGTSNYSSLAAAKSAALSKCTALVSGATTTYPLLTSSRTISDDWHSKIVEIKYSCGSVYGPRSNKSTKWFGSYNNQTCTSGQNCCDTWRAYYIQYGDPNPQMTYTAKQALSGYYEQGNCARTSPPVGTCPAEFGCATPKPGLITLLEAGSCPATSTMLLNVASSYSAQTESLVPLPAPVPYYVPGGNGYTSKSDAICFGSDLIFTIKAVTKKCQITPIPAIVDPDIQTYEDGRINTADIDETLSENLTCLENSITDNGGSSTVTSGYRPVAYQQHIRDVWDKWKNELENDQSPECADLKKTVKAHFKRHGLVHEPAVNSKHSAGDAFDMSVSNLPADKKIDALAGDCALHRRLKVADPVHFENKPADPK